MRFNPIVRAAQVCIYFAQVVYITSRRLHKINSWWGYSSRFYSLCCVGFMLEHLTTEARNPASEDLDGLSAIEIVQLINSEDAKVAAAVALEGDVIAQAIDVIADRIGRGGRLIYFGAGTSGRLGVLDAVECPPTFNTHPSQVVGLIAGGYSALTTAVEGAEDRPELAVEDLKNARLTEGDVVCGIATSGRTPYVMGGLEYARSIGAYAIGLSCNRDSAIATRSDICITP